MADLGEIGLLALDTPLAGAINANVPSVGQLGVIALETPLASAINANIPANGQIGTIPWETANNIGYTVSGTVIDSFNNPLFTTVHLLSRATSTGVPATIEMLRTTDAETGAYTFAVGTNTQRAVLVFDNSSPYLNSILIDKVVPG